MKPAHIITTADQDAVTAAFDRHEARTVACPICRAPGRVECAYCVGVGSADAAHVAATKRATTERLWASVAAIEAETDGKAA